jgi:hypothetical protein
MIFFKKEKSYSLLFSDINLNNLWDKHLLMHYSESSLCLQNMGTSFPQ